MSTDAAAPLAPPNGGIVYLVGAGPGDAALITLRGVECLARADLVLYDYLVNPLILRHARSRTERLCLGRHGAGKLMAQDEINQRMIDAARAGKTVVRLKGGDPCVFARAGEEIEALRAADVVFEIVPGITAALAAASYAGIPLTHRDLASAVALVTGMEGESKTTPTLDFAALAAFPGTLVFYMGITTAAEWTTALIEHGKPRQTPAAIVRRGSWPNQSTIRCRLETVAETIREQRLRPPAIVIVGPVAGLDTASDWARRRPLLGRRILVTRAADQAAALSDPLRELGAEVLEQPAIEIHPPEDWAPLDRAIDELERFDWLVFSSTNAVRGFVERLWARGGDSRRLGRARLAAIGPGTAAELEQYHLRTDVEPAIYRAEALAARLAPEAAGSRFLLIRANRGREVLAAALRAAGGDVVEAVAYESRDVTQADPDVLAALERREIDVVTVTSSAIARSLVALVGAHLRGARLASLSPITSATLVELGYPPAIEAAEYTMPGLVAAIVADLRDGDERTG